MPILKITDIEDAIVLAIKDGLTYLDSVRTMGELLVNEIENTTLIYPSVLVVHKSSEYDYSVSNVQDIEYTFGIIIVVRSLRTSISKGDKDIRHGTDQEKGVYDILEDIRALLTDSKVDLDEDTVIKPLIPTVDLPLQQDINLALHEIDFTISIRNLL